MKRFILLSLLFAASLCGATACPAGYAHSYTINIPPSAVFGGATITNKGWRWSGGQDPVTGANFAQSGSGGQSLTSGGLDVVFCDSTATNLIAYELVANTYVGTTGYGQWYFLIPSLSPSTGASVTVEVGKSSASDLSSAAGVWGSAGENDLMAHHFGTVSTLTLTDSTGNCTATNNGATAAAGFIDGGAALNGSSQYIDTGCVGSSSTYTVETWTNTNSVSSAHIIAGNMDSSASELTGFIFYQNAYGLGIDVGTSTGANHCVTSSTLGIPSVASGTWQHTAFSYNGVNATLATSYAFYTNGLPVFCAMNGTHGTAMGTPTAHMLYGRWINASFPDYFSGTLDEIRICGCVRTAGWIQTSWFNETFPSQSSYLGATNTIPTTGLDQFPRIIQFSNASGVFPNNLTAGSSILVIGRATGVPGTPTGCSASYTLIDSNTAGVAVNPYVWLGTGGSGSCTVSLTGSVGYHAIELPAALGSTIDVHSNGSLAVAGQVIPTALTTTQNNEFMFCYVTGNQGAESILATAVSNSSPQWNAMTASSGTNGTFAESYAYTGVNGAYSCPFDNYNGESASANTAEEYVELAIKASSIGITTASLPSGSTTHPYFYCMQAQGGAGAYTWSISSGSMPTGLTLNSNGCITGTPTGGTQTPTFQVTDGTHTTTSAITLTVNSSVNSCTVATSSSNTGNITVSVGSVTSGNLILVGTLAGNDDYVQLPTDTLSTAYKYIGTINSRFAGLSLLNQMVLFQGVAGSSGSDSVTSVCAGGGGSCYTVAAQFSGCQTFFDNVSTIIGSSTNILASTTLYGPPLNTTPSALVWGLIGNYTNGAVDLSLTAGSGWTGDASSGNAGVADMLGEHQTGTGGFTPTWGVTAAPTSPYQTMFDLALRPTTSGIVNTNHRRAWVISQP